MCSEQCVETPKRSNLIKPLIFFTWLIVLDIYVRIVKIYWLQVPWHNIEKSDPYQTISSIASYNYLYFK